MSFSLADQLLFDDETDDADDFDCEFDEDFEYISDEEFEVTIDYDEYESNDTEISGEFCSDDPDVFGEFDTFEDALAEKDFEYEE